MIARRVAVLAVLAVCALLVSPLPLLGLGLVAAPALAALDAVLLAATGGLAFARAGSLDERQAALRDLAYRRGFRLLGLGIVAAVMAWVVSSYVLVVLVGPSGGLTEVDSGISGRLLVAIAELIVMLPSLVIAWSPREVRGPGGKLVPAFAVPALAVGWLLALAWAPAQPAAVAHDFSVSTSESTCAHFVAGRIVGGGFGATVGMRVEVCWNGKTAALLPEPDRFFTACGADNVEDFAVVSGTTCTTTVDARGTLHYTVHGHVEPLPFSMGARDVSMELAVARDGRVLRQP
jgi:hypothetical protein